jgi:hypothetical protein
MGEVSVGQIRHHCLDQLACTGKAAFPKRVPDQEFRFDAAQFGKNCFCVELISNETLPAGADVCQRRRESGVKLAV